MTIDNGTITVGLIGLAVALVGILALKLLRQFGVFLLIAGALTVAGVGAYVGTDSTS